jgi:3-hydroxyisobutyrate dehydrogenase
MDAEDHRPEGGEVSAATRAKVGVAGVGMIGGNVSRTLTKAGWEVLGYDLRAEAFDQFPEVRCVAKARELATETDTVLISVYDDAQLRDVLSGIDGILAGESGPSITCVLSTITLPTLRWAVEQAEEAGVELIDCGVTGGGGLLTHGRIVVLAGGSERAIEQARPVLGAFADPLLQIGAVGAGMQAKLARNLMHYSDWYAACEAARIAVACGVDLDKLIEGHLKSYELSGGAAGGTDLLSRGIGPGPADLDDEAALAGRRMAADYAAKDLGYVIELGRELGIPLPGAELVSKRIDLVVGLADEE